MKSAKPFIFESGKTYRLKGSFRDISAASPKLYFEIIPLDADGREILPAHLSAMAKTETELTEDAKAGDLAVKLKNTAAWKAFDRRRCIAWGKVGDGRFIPMQAGRLFGDKRIEEMGHTGSVKFQFMVVFTDFFTVFTG